MHTEIHTYCDSIQISRNVSQVLRQCSSGIGTWYIYVHLTVLTEFKKIMMITTTWIENHGFFHDFLSKTWTFPVAILRCLPQLGLFDSLAPCPAAAIRGCRSGGWHEGRAAASLGGMGWDLWVKIRWLYFIDILIYFGGCSFCSFMITLWLRLT